MAGAELKRASLAKTSAPCCRDGHSGVALLTAEAAPQVAHCGSLRNRAILTVPDLASRAIHVGMSCIPLVHNSILPELLSRAPLLIFDPQVAGSGSLCSTEPNTLFPTWYPQILVGAYDSLHPFACAAGDLQKTLSSLLSDHLLLLIAPPLMRPPFCELPFWGWL